jgi:hypothetical protein
VLANRKVYELANRQFGRSRPDKPCHARQRTEAATPTEARASPATVMKQTNGMLWTLTEARGKYTTRYRSQGSIDALKGTKLQHSSIRFSRTRTRSRDRRNRRRLRRDERGARTPHAHHARAAARNGLAALRSSRNHRGRYRCHAMANRQAARTASGFAARTLSNASRDSRFAPRILAALKISIARME